MNRIVLGLMFSLVTQNVMAGKCEELAKPKSFNKDSAMEAIYCEYDRTHGGTLLPLKHTKSWDTKDAEILATPLLTATYRENGVRKGVIAIQRQQMQDGEPAWQHAVGATVSVYVFSNDGQKWVFEKGKMEVLNAGAHGFAPGGRLVRLGPEKYGLWFEGGDVHQGYTNDYAYVVALSEQDVHEAGHFSTGESNIGACSDDPNERDAMVGACWGHEGRPEFIVMQGSAYYMLRIAYQGTEQTDINDRNKTIPKNDPMCYTFTDGKYEQNKDRNCADHNARDARDIFGVGENEERSQPIPSIPRKLLK